MPSVQFDQATYATKETAGVLSVMLMRSGDLSLQSSVRCYTRQMSARVGEDFVERPDSPESAVTFRPGQSTQICNVAVRDDSVYEGPEEFRLVLRSVVSDVRIGKKPQAVISISDKEDSEYPLREPLLLGMPEHRGNMYLTSLPLVSGNTYLTSLPLVSVFDVTSIGQRSSPWTCNSVKVELTFHLECKLRSSCEQLYVATYTLNDRI